jgi:hypothetical protein
MKTLKDACNYRFEAPPYSTKALIDRFNPNPRHSIAALLRKTGPFLAERDAYGFTNAGWAITEEDARVLREHYQSLVEPVSLIGIEVLRHSLSALSFTIPIVGAVGLPAVAIDYVINQVTRDLRNQLLDKIVSSTPGEYGRCGGMAFSGYDFFLVGWSVDRFGTVQPASGDLRQYIWNRLLDSLELNASTFLEWVMILHVLPVISTLASAALGAAAGSVGGPLGVAIAAFVAGKNDVLGLGGADALLDKTRDHWGRLKARLDQEAACPIGFVYSGSANPIDQHQVLAIKYDDLGNQLGNLWVWDNNSGKKKTFLRLNFGGSELQVDSSNPKLNAVKGIVCEDYSFRMPLESLRP